MLRSLEELIGYKIEATDGELGHVTDILFDGHSWIVRYLVVNTGSWLLGREVLISPQAMKEPNWEKSVVPVTMTREKVRHSPSSETDVPFSRQYERRLVDYYNWAPYWLTPGGMFSPWLTTPLTPLPPGGRTITGFVNPLTPGDIETMEESSRGDPELRSFKDVMGYRIGAIDTRAGHVGDLIAQTEGWVIRYLVVELGDSLPERRVLVSSAWTAQVEWTKRIVQVDLTLDELRGSAESNLFATVNRPYKGRRRDSFGRPKYRTEEFVESASRKK